MGSCSICNNKERHGLGEQGRFHFPSVLFCLLRLIKLSPPLPHIASNNQRTMEEEHRNSVREKQLMVAMGLRADICRLAQHR